MFKAWYCLWNLNLLLGRNLSGLRGFAFESGFKQVIQAGDSGRWFRPMIQNQKIFSFMDIIRTNPSNGSLSIEIPDFGIWIPKREILLKRTYTPHIIHWNSELKLFERIKLAHWFMQLERWALCSEMESVFYRKSSYSCRASFNRAFFRRASLVEALG